MCCDLFRGVPSIVSRPIPIMEGDEGNPPRCPMTSKKGSSIMKRFITTIAIASAAALAPTSAAVVSAAGNGAGGVTGPAFYVDGELYRTVGTPTDLSGTGAPAHSYDTIYAIDGQPNVATAAPGDEGYNGGRWQVLPITIDDYAAALAVADTNNSGDLDSDEELDAAVGAGLASIGESVRSFVCPVIPVPGH
jgi:hypothetical protein